MNLRNAYKMAALGLLMLPLVGGTCTDEKLVALVIGAETVAAFDGSGSVNSHEDSQTVDVKSQLNLQQVVDDADVDIEALDASSVKVKRVFYKVTGAEPGRSMNNGEISAGSGTSSGVFISGLTVDFSSTTDWIDITGLIDSGGTGLAFLNGWLEDCVEELQGVPGASAGMISYSVLGTSDPQDDFTGVSWALKVEISGIVRQSFDVPDFGL